MDSRKSKLQNLKKLFEQINKVKDTGDQIVKTQEQIDSFEKKRDRKAIEKEAAAAKAAESSPTTQEEEKLLPFKSVNQMIKDQKKIKNHLNLETNFELYKKNAMEYVNMIDVYLDNPDKYPYTEQDIFRLKSIKTSQIKRIRQFENNDSKQVQDRVNKRDQHVSKFLNILDQKLSQRAKD